MLPTTWRVTKKLPCFTNSSPIPLVKSDRINSLRKKYDAFLEEDKKRKERNEYILEKLDKMRTCTAVVPVRHKSSAFTEIRTATSHNMPQPIIDSPHNDQVILQRHPDMPKKQVHETVLQEISKKYILIPKNRPTYDNYSREMKPTLDDNTDWKRKYQILEQLKKDEKEPDSPTQQETYLANHYPENNHFKDTAIKDDYEPILTLNDEKPEKLLSYDLQNGLNDKAEEVEQQYYDYEHHTLENTDDGSIYSKNNVENHATAKVEGNEGFENYEPANTIIDNVNERFENYENVNANYQEDTNNTNEFSAKNSYEYNENVDENSITEPQINSAIQINKQNTPSEIFTLSTNEKDIEKEYVPLESEPNEEPKRQNDGDNQINNNQGNYLDKEEVTLVQDVNAGDLINVLNKEIMPESEINEVPHTEYPVETINVQDFTPHEDVQLQDGVNINPEPQVLVGQEDLTYHYDPAVETENTTEPTKTFDNEQNQEFYNEQTEQNYDYTEEGVVDNYNTEYTAPNENYPQNEYAYYEGAPTEQAYPEANEETTQRYDQTYEEQYGAGYEQESYPEQGYEQGYTQGFEQQLENYEAPDQAQQGLDNVPYETQENLAPETVEQQLDNEQGYAENQDDKSGEAQQSIKVDDQQVQ